MSIILSVPFVGAVLGFLGLRLGDNPVNVLDYHLLLRRFALVLVGDADAVGHETERDYCRRIKEIPFVQRGEVREREAC